MSRRPIIVLDFGSQYTQLIARRIRELRVYSQIHPYNLPLTELRACEPAAIVLSGGPASCYDADAPRVDPGIFDLGVPILGICYGLQLVVRHFGGEVTPSDKREYGRALMRELSSDFPLWHGLSGSHQELSVWMSHGDHITTLPPDFRAAARTENSEVVAAWHPERELYGLQFHPEVAHTPEGMEMLTNFVYRVCGCAPNWTMASFVESQLAAIKDQVGDDGGVICGLSGGVDSSVAAALVHRAVGDRLHCILVDNGLLRAGEATAVATVFREQFHIPLTIVEAKPRFLRALGGVTDPEKKRKIIGNEFIRVFEAEANRLRPPAQFLVQGTLYPDVIESVSFKGPSATIKSHHNVGGLPERMDLSLVEPLRELFKDEVRRLGEELALPEHILWRHPFPGPGLAVRILGEVTEARILTLQAADTIIEEEIRAAGLYRSIWQVFGVLLPVQSVGVMGDYRTYESVLAVRAVHSTDGMTADWVKLPYEVLGTISNRIINEVSGINRVVYDISSKPPATIEWE